MMKQPSKIQLSTDSFARVLGYESHAVDANSQGIMTQAQKQRMAEEMKADADGMWLLMTIFLGVLLLIAFILQGSSTVGMDQLLIGGGIMLGGLLFFSYNRRSAMQGDVQDSKIEHVDGMAQLEYGGIGEDRRYWLRVGDKKFRIKQDQFMALNEYDLAPMRLYYSAYSKTVLSAEVQEWEKEKNDDKLKNDDLILNDSEWQQADEYDADMPDMKREETRG